MTDARRFPTLLLAGLLAAASAQAAGPVERLPAGAQVVGYFDLAAFNASPAVGVIPQGWLGGEFGMDADFFARLGVDSGFERMAFGGFPSGEGDDLDIALIVDGTWDEAKMKSALLDEGAVEVAIAGHPSYRMPKTEDGDDFVVSFLDAGRLAVSDWDLVETVRAGGGQLSKPLSTELASLPEKLSAWLVVSDPLDAGAATGVDAGAAAGMADGLRSMSIWARATQSLEVGASALAKDKAQASQLGMLLQVGLMALSSNEIAGDWKDLLSQLRFDTQGERLQLSLSMSPEQVGRLMTEFGELAQDSLPGAGGGAAGR